MCHVACCHVVSCRMLSCRFMSSMCELALSRVKDKE